MKNGRKALIGVLLAVASCMLAQTNNQHKHTMVKGNASYYSDKLHGRRMSNGEKYDRDSFTCAHLRFPLGTVLKVRNPRNDKECIVRVTDRGPHSKKFVIDLSRAAAKHLGIIGAGYAMVEITPYYSGTIPYKLQDPELPEIPELDINYNPAATYPNPAWQRDSIDTEGK